LEELAFNKQYTQISDAFPDLEVVEGARHLQEQAAEFGARVTLRGCAPKIVYDDSVFDPDAVNDLTSAEAMKFVAPNTNGKKLSDCIILLGFNDPDSINAIRAMQDNFDKAADKTVGLNELENGAPLEDQKELTATHITALDQDTKSRMNRRQRATDDWQNKQAQHRAMVCREHTPPEIVAKICGDEAAKIWGIMAPDMQDLTHQYSVTVMAGSTGEMAKAEQFAKLKEIRAQMSATNAEVGYAHYNVTELDNEMLSLSDLPDIEKYINPPPPPKTAGQDFQITGPSVKGLQDLVEPPPTVSPDGAVIPNTMPPLLSWLEARKILGQPAVLNAEIDPAQLDMFLKHEAMAKQQVPPAPKPQGFAPAQGAA
jgi:hypothetical protein